MVFAQPQFSSYISKGTRAMKSIILAVLLVGCALAEDAPYPPSGTRPQGALLVLPTELASANENRPAPQYAAPQYLAPQTKPETENLQKANENTLEQLRQAQGADSGSYYVYLADGRLQRVQYVTAPLRQSPPQSNNQQVNLQNTQTFQNAQTLQFNQQNAQANAKLQNFGQDKSQSKAQGQYSYPTPAFNGQYQNAQANAKLQNFGQDQSQSQAQGQYSYPTPAFNGQYQQTASGQYKQQQASFNQFKQQPSGNQFNEEAASTQYNQQVPSGSYRQQQQKPEKLKQQPSASQPSLYPQGQPLGSNQYSKVSFQGASSNENPASAQQQLYPLQQQSGLEFQQPEQNQLAFQQQVYLQPQQNQVAYQQQILQQPLAASYVASVQFTEVQPIATPIYTYTPAPLVRILRYAPRYQ